MTQTLTSSVEAARAAEMVGDATSVLSESQIRAFVRQSLDAVDLDGRSVCLVIPDGTRSCPLPLLIDEVHRALSGRVTKLTALVALGTHAAMPDADLAAHLGYGAGGPSETYPGLDVRNHIWWEPDTFVTIGTVPAARIEQLSNGLLRQDVVVRLNRAVVEHDVALVVGPVFPHEVVGFSGGNKYFFPGVGGQDLIDISHWLGALITSSEMIGSTGVTPVRALINAAADLIPSEKLALCVVARSGTDQLHAVTFGGTEVAWAAASEVSAKAHVQYLDHPVRRVLSVMPRRYDDMWTAAKGFYKAEPIVADGGEVIIYAPHISELSRMHPEIARIGYHCRDYFLSQWDRFEGMHWGVLAHSTHLAGSGSYDDVYGERLRVRVTLATGIPERLARAANLGYLDPASFDIDAYERDRSTLVVRDAGEVLFRLR
jgi:nickel-dependent lactate racemase